MDMGNNTNDILANLETIRRQLAEAWRAGKSKNLVFELPGLSASENEIVRAELTPSSGHFFSPSIISDLIVSLLRDAEVHSILDPCAQLGLLLSSLAASTGARTLQGLEVNNAMRRAGEILFKQISWVDEIPLVYLDKSDRKFDVIASVLPFGVRWSDNLSLTTEDGSELIVRGDYGFQVLAASIQHLSQSGVAFFVVPPSFFLSSNSIRHRLSYLDAHVESAFLLPSETFAPYTNIRSYLIVVKRGNVTPLFIAEISGDKARDDQCISNAINREPGKTLELGRLVDAMSFVSLARIRIDERLQYVATTSGFQELQLNEIALESTIASVRHDWSSDENAIFIPDFSKDDVILSQDDMTLKPEHYSYIVLNEESALAAFVQKFLNSDLGRELRSERARGTTIRRLGSYGLHTLPILLPPLEVQKEILGLETSAQGEANVLLSLQNELSELRRAIWERPKDVAALKESLGDFGKRLIGIREHAEQNLDQWFETLPFPLASILRVWWAASPTDYEHKYKHLLHFFEAHAQFVSTIFLSAYSSTHPSYETFRAKIVEHMTELNLSFDRANFAIWKFLVEYLGSQTRVLLSKAISSGGSDDTPNGAELCREMFADPSLELARALSDKRLTDLIERTYRYRNEWSAHTGVDSPSIAESRNNTLQKELETLREILGNVWEKSQLVRGGKMDFVQGIFRTDLSLLKGSNSAFLKESRDMSIPLDKDGLYLSNKDSSNAIKLVPLVALGPPPQSANVAAYFYNRIDKAGKVRLVSYHYDKEPEIDSPIEGLKEFLDTFKA